MKTAREIIAGFCTDCANWTPLYNGRCGCGSGRVACPPAGFSIVETGRDPVTIEACAAIAEGTFKSEHDFGRAGSVIAHAIRSSTREGKT